MRNILLLTLASSLVYVKAQTGYEKIYEGDGSLALVPFNGDSLLACMGWGPSLSLLDESGNVLRSDHPLSTELYVPLSVDMYTPSTYYFIGNNHVGSCDADWRLDPAIGMMDSAGNVLALQGYEMSGYCPNFLKDIEITHDGSALAWDGVVFSALKVDSSLALVWSKHFDRHGSFQFIRELPGGDLLAGINMDTAGAVVARMDASGDFLWCKSYIRPGGMVHDCVIESDSSYIITGLTDVVASPDQHLFMMKLDGEGDVQWCRGYNSAQHWYSMPASRIVSTDGGDYAILATSGSRAVLMKTDANGDTLWTRSAGAPGYSFETVDLVASWSGSFLFSGAISGNLPGMNTSMAYIFKTDTLGHLPCSEDAPPPIAIAVLFPMDSSFTLTATADSATAYPISVSNGVFPSILVYDACLVTLVPPTPQVTKFRVRPNPTTGRFAVEFADPLMADSYYSIYDTMGRLLYQRPLPAGATVEEVDLSRFGKGTYAIKLTDKAGVRFERVVVE